MLLDYSLPPKELKVGDWVCIDYSHVSSLKTISEIISIEGKDFKIKYLSHNIKNYSIYTPLGTNICSTTYHRIIKLDKNNYDSQFDYIANSVIWENINPDIEKHLKNYKIVEDFSKNDVMYVDIGDKKFLSKCKYDSSLFSVSNQLFLEIHVYNKYGLFERLHRPNNFVKATEQIIKDNRELFDKIPKLEFSELFKPIEKETESFFEYKTEPITVEPIYIDSKLEKDHIYLIKEIDICRMHIGQFISTGDGWATFKEIAHTKIKDTSVLFKIHLNLKYYTIEKELESKEDLYRCLQEYSNFWTAIDFEYLEKRSSQFFYCLENKIFDEPFLLDFNSNKNLVEFVAKHYPHKYKLPGKPISFGDAVTKSEKIFPPVVDNNLNMWDISLGILTTLLLVKGNSFKSLSANSDETKKEKKCLN